jgi:hypothetical protein
MSNYLSNVRSALSRSISALLSLRRLLAIRGLGVLLFASVNVWAAPITATWTTGVGSNDHIYTLYDTALSWSAAQADAVARGGHLVTITSPEEQAFLDANFFGFGYFIGLSDAGAEGTFAWVTGEPTTYLHWHPVQPDNFGGNEDFVQVRSSDGLWNDVPEAGFPGLFYVVETSIPEPTSEGVVFAALITLVWMRRHYQGR